MRENNSSEIVKRGESLLPASDLSAILNALPEEQKLALLTKVAEGQVSISEEATIRVFKSKLAQHDIDNFTSRLNALAKGKKLFSARAEGETGSGTYKIDVKGVGW